MRAPRSPRTLGRVGHRTMATGVLLVCFVAAALAARISSDPNSAGRRDLESGHARAAVSSLRKAAAERPDDASRSLWLAQAVLMGEPDSVQEWKRAAYAAARGETQLRGDDAARARALGALADGRFGAACPGFRTLLRRHPDDISLRIDLAECLARDVAVVPDVRSASGWRFRSDRSEAVRLLTQLIDSLPDGSEERLGILQRIPALLTIEWGQYQRGVSATDSTIAFGAFPSLEHYASGDDVAYVPYPLSSFRAGRAFMDPPNLERAIEHERAVLRAAAKALAIEQPRSASAHAALAESLELDGELAPVRDGDASALTEIREARRLATSASQYLHYSAAEVRLMVKQGEFAAARILADTLIKEWPQPDRASSDDIASLLALVGRARALAALLERGAPGYTDRMPDGRRFHPHPVLGEATLGLAAYAQVGGPLDSLVALRARAEQAISGFAAPQAADSIRVALMARSLSLAVPVLGASAVAGLQSSTRLVQAQQAFGRHDAATARAMLDSLRQMRAGHAAAVRVDQAYQEAWLRAAIGDSAGAARELDAVLDGLPALGTRFLSQTSEAASLARAMELRAQLARRRGDRAAATRWTAAVKALWAEADPELRRW